MGRRIDVDERYVLQSYRSCTFCKRKTRGEAQFWIDLAAPYTLANHNEINSDDKLPFIFFLTPATGVNVCCFRYAPYDVIKQRYSVASLQKMWTVRKVIERYSWN